MNWASYAWGFGSGLVAIFAGSIVSAKLILKNPQNFARMVMRHGRRLHS